MLLFRPAVMGLLLILSSRGLAAQSTESSVEFADPAAEQEFYELLWMLDELATPPPVALSDDELFGDQIDAEVPDEEVIDAEWMLTFLSMLGEELTVEVDRAEADLRASLLQLRRAEANSAGNVRQTLAAAAAGIADLIEPTSRISTADATTIRYAIAEGQRAMGVYFCARANQDPAGTLANPVPTMAERLSDLSAAARYMMAASRTANFRIPNEAKRALAASIAMSRLFTEKEVRLRVVRTRAREIERGLADLGGAIARAKR